MKGIILAGGSGTRLHPLTIAVSKQLLPVYDKPMIYYPLSTLISAGIDDVFVITTPKDRPLFESLLGDGTQWGVHISYGTQDRPNGIAEAFLLAEDFIAESSITLILGDNLFVGELPLGAALRETGPDGAHIFATKVAKSNTYGVVELDETGRAISIEEKPLKPRSNLAVAGLYVFSSGVVDIAKRLSPSARGELEITEVINHYLELGSLGVTTLDDRVFWFDMGTPDTLFEAGELVRALQKRRGDIIGQPSLMGQSIRGA